MSDLPHDEEEYYSTHCGWCRIEVINFARAAKV